MKTSAHWNLLLSNQVDKKKFVKSFLSQDAPTELSFLNSLKGVLFSDLAIKEFIKKEYQYDSITYGLIRSRKFNTLSSGEQKTAYLHYCLAQNPDYIVFDNPLDHLDQNTRLALIETLKKLATTTIIIQIVNRKADLLPFITNNRQVHSDSFDLIPIVAGNHNFEKSYKLNVPLPLESATYEGNVLIQMNQVSVSYQERHIVNNINWTVKKGEFWQLIGPNGSGKSTILSLITGENAKGYGQDLYLFGNKKGSGESIWDIKKQIGYFSTAMTDLYLKSHTLEQMILSGFFDSIGLYVQPTSTHIKLVSKWLDLIEMRHLKNKVFNQLSIGQQRLALIVRAVLKHPPLVILDEPLEGLDDTNTSLITQLINTLITETTMTIIYVSHRIEPSLSPQAVLELIPSPEGSIGIIKR
jgi:molybdate transport system ATP-binding protein